MKQTITEEQLKAIISESVKKVLNEIRIKTNSGEEYDAHGDDPVAWAHLAQKRADRNQNDKSWKNVVNAKDTFNQKYGKDEVYPKIHQYDNDEFRGSATSMPGNDYTLRNSFWDQDGIDKTRRDQEDIYNPYDNVLTRNHSKRSIYTHATPDNTTTTTSSNHIADYKLKQDYTPAFRNDVAKITARKMAKANPSSQVPTDARGFSQLGK